MGGPEAEGVHAASRILVYGLITAFLVCGFAGIEAWPLSGWRFFVHVRSPFQRTWTASVVVPGEASYPVRFSTLSPAMHDFVPVMRSVPSLDRAQRLRTCQSWARAALPAGATAVLRIYAETWDVSDRTSTPTDPDLSRTIVIECRAPGRAGPRVTR